MLGPCYGPAPGVVHCRCPECSDDHHALTTSIESRSATPSSRQHSTDMRLPLPLIGILVRTALVERRRATQTHGCLLMLLLMEFEASCIYTVGSSLPWLTRPQRVLLPWSERHARHFLDPVVEPSWSARAFLWIATANTPPLSGNRETRNAGLSR